jgi:5-(carboxyamino)imidazole ribonucleotide synthase
MMNPLPPPAVIGIIGGGQLGMMIIREAQRMGYQSIVWDPDPECPASRLADWTITAAFTDTSAAERLGEQADVITYEFENVDAGMVERLERTSPVYPGSAILRTSRHRRTEKEELGKRGFPVAEYVPAGNASEVYLAIEKLGLPVVVKTATAGYDGKGQSVLRSEGDKHEFLRTQPSTGEYVVERLLPLQCEISVLVARGHDGTITTFPIPENEHRENILHSSLLPARVNPEITEEAHRIARAIIESFNIYGLLCVEMFVTTAGKVLVNELAPRPHNSGHYTLDACSMSQFEAAIRAICGLPIPEPHLLSPCAMVNLLGKHLAVLNMQRLLSLDGVKLHIYGKKRIEPKRKMGHLTIVQPTTERVLSTLSFVRGLVGEYP